MPDGKMCLALKTRKKRIIINPLSSDFWRGYTGQKRSATPTEQESELCKAEKSARV